MSNGPDPAVELVASVMDEFMSEEETTSEMIEVVTALEEAILKNIKESDMDSATALSVLTDFSEHFEADDLFEFDQMEDDREELFRVTLKMKAKAVEAYAEWKLESLGRNL